MGLNVRSPEAKHASRNRDCGIETNRLFVVPRPGGGVRSAMVLLTLIGCGTCSKRSKKNNMLVDSGSRDRFGS